MKRRKMRQLPLWDTPFPKRGRTLHVRLTDDQHEHLVRRAKAVDILLSELVRRCLAKQGPP